MRSVPVVVDDPLVECFEVFGVAGERSRVGPLAGECPVGSSAGRLWPIRLRTPIAVITVSTVSIVPFWD